MNEIGDHQQSYRLPPIQQLPRTLRPASIASLVDGHPTELSASPSPVNTFHTDSVRLPPPSPPSISREPPRDRRISAACAACKKRKSKCTGGPPPCKLCRIAGLDCVINESLDGRRKLATKRVQDELQQHKLLLDSLLDGIRSPEKSDRLTGLIHSYAPLSEISDLLSQPSLYNKHGVSARVPIDLLIDAEDEVLVHRAVDSDGRGLATKPASPMTHRSASSSTSGPIALPESMPALQDDARVSYHLVQTLAESSEQEAFSLFQGLRRSRDTSSFLQQFRQYSLTRPAHDGLDRMT